MVTDVKMHSGVLMKSFKIVASDLDGTLFNSRGEVSPENLAVSNSCPELLSAADEVICSNDNHAIEYILNSFILK